MASVFNWMDKSWPFTSDSDFICNAKISGTTYSVLKMEINSSLSTPFEIILILLTSNVLDETFAESQNDVIVNLLYNNVDLMKTFQANLISFSYKGEAFVLSSNSTSTATPKNVYELILRPDGWNAQQKIKTCIFHEKTKAQVIKEVMKPYNTTATLSDDSNLVTKEVITQYKETDFDFSLRLMEEEGYFCFYDFSSSIPLFTIKNSATVSTGAAVATLNSLNLVSEIHDNFNFNELIDLKLKTDAVSKVSDPEGFLLKKTKIDSLKKVAELTESNSKYTKFSCESTSYKLFAGDYFIVSQSSSSKSLISPLSSTQYFFIEKSTLILNYKESIGWYIRNKLEGFVVNGGVPTYRLERKTKTPIVTDTKKAYVCGAVKNSLYVNSEGNVRVRFTWIPFNAGTAAEKKAAEEKAEVTKKAYIESREILAQSISSTSDDAADKVNDKISSTADTANEALDAAGDAGVLAKVGSEAAKLLVNVTSSVAQTGVDVYFSTLSENYSTSAEQDSLLVDEDDFLQDSTAIWSIENSDTRALSGWIPTSNWGSSGNSSGNYQYPRVGQIISVSFVEGNPDYPIVVGSSYSNLFDEYDASTETTKVPEIPYATVTKANAASEAKQKTSVLTGLASEASSAISSLKDELSSLVSDSSKFLDMLEGTLVPDLIPYACREVGSTGKIKNTSSFETNDIQKAAGNMVIKSFAYDSSLRTNRAGWNEISFFNERYNEALRISSAHYLFLHSRDIVHIMAPSLLKEQLGKRMTTISGNKYEIVSGNSNYYLGGNGITFYPGSMARSSVEYNDGMTIERLSMEVAQKFMGHLQGFTGSSQIIGTFANEALMAYVSLLGDWISILFLGNYSLATIVGNIAMSCVGGSFIVAANAVEFSVLGAYNVNVIGAFYVNSMLRVYLNSKGTIILNSLNTIKLDALNNIRIYSGAMCDIHVVRQMNIKAEGKMDIQAKGMMSISSMGLMDISAKGGINLSSDGMIKISARMFTLSSQIVNISGSGICKISGGLIQLG